MGGKDIYKMMGINALHNGHRERARERFIRHGADVMTDYELLELLLFSVFKRCDTYTRAKKLLESFSTLGGVFSARRDELMRVEGVGSAAADFLIAVGEYIKPFYDEMSVSGTWKNPELISALLTDAADSDEAVYLLAFDNANRLIGKRRVFSCRLFAAEVKPKPVIDAALSMRAAFAVLAAKRAHGASLASEGERESFKLLRKSLEGFGIPLVDLISICGSRARLLSGEEFISAELKTSPKNNGIYGLESLLAFSSCDTDYKKITTKYKTKTGLLCADYRELSALSLSSGTAFLLTVAAATAARVGGEGLSVGDVPDEARLCEYIKALFLNRSDECFFALFFRGDEFRGAEKIAEGTVSSVGVVPRVLAEKAAVFCADGLILAHNHPRGEAAASKEDEAATAQLRAILSDAGISLIAHYVAAGEDISKVKMI